MGGDSSSAADSACVDILPWVINDIIVYNEWSFYIDVYVFKFIHIFTYKYLLFYGISIFLSPSRSPSFILSLFLSLSVLARLAQLLCEFFIKRSAHTKVVGIHNIQKLVLKILGEEGCENSLAISNQAFWLGRIGLGVAFKISQLGWGCRFESPR